MRREGCCGVENQKVESRMTHKGRARGSGRIVNALAIGFVSAGGCSEHRKSAGPMLVPNPTLGAVTIAVAPAVNLSGSTDFDPGRFGDLMAGELMHVERVSVIPVSRVLAVLASQGTDRIHSPAHASEIAGMVGADAILVVAVTEYDAFDPPSLAMSVQLFAAAPRDAYGAPLDAGDANPELKATGRVLAQTQRRLDASHEDVVEDIRAYARQRSADNSPYGWRRYVVSQQHFIQYGCHAVLRGLLDGQGWPILAGRGVDQ
jgi:hypothetical protein